MRQNIDGVIGEIDTLPGCTQIAISHSVYLPTIHRGKGKGTLANSKRQRIIFDELGYDMMICTIDSSNTCQKQILRANGWKLLDKFVSSKTEHLVELWSCKRKFFDS